MHCRSSKYETLVGDKYPYKQAGLPVFSPWIGPAHPLTAFTDSGLLNGFFILFLFVIILVSARAVNQTNSVSVLLGLYALNITLIVWPYQPTGHTFLFLKLKPLKLSLDCLFWLPPLWDCDDVLLSISLDSISFAFSPQNNTDTSKLSILKKLGSYQEQRGLLPTKIPRPSAPECTAVHPCVRRTFAGTDRAL